MHHKPVQVNEIIEIVILEEDRDEMKLLKQIANDLHAIKLKLVPDVLTKTIKVQFKTGELIMNNDLVITFGQTSQISIQPELKDGVTPSGGTVSKVTFNFNDPSATVALNTDGLTGTVTAVAPSTGAVSGTVSNTVTDTDGAVSVWNAPFTITVNAPVPPAQLTQSENVVFSTPA